MHIVNKLDKHNLVTHYGGLLVRNSNLRIEYSDRNSSIYDLRRDARTVKRLINTENQKQMGTIDGQAHKTLSEEEIIGEGKKS